MTDENTTPVTPTTDTPAVEGTEENAQTTEKTTPAPEVEVSTTKEGATPEKVA